MSESPGSAAAVETYKYAAFISYRHGKEDEKAAKWLMGALESYKLPAQIARPRKLPRKLGRCFRDVDELRGSSSLENSLLSSLAESRCLIAICSPRYRLSDYCGLEIKAFHDMGRHDRIFALLIDGDPVDRTGPANPFRPELLSYQRIVEKDGIAQTQTVQVEPLCADLRPQRGVSKSRLREIAKLRIVSALIQCEYNELYRRERRRARQQLIRFVAVMVMVLAVIATLALGMLHAKDQAARAIRTTAEEALKTAAATQQYAVEKKHAASATQLAALTSKQKQVVELLSKARDLCKSSVDQSAVDPELAALLALQANNFQNQADPESLAGGNLTPAIDNALRTVLGRDNFCASLPCPASYVVTCMATSNDGHHVAGSAYAGTFEQALTQLKEQFGHFSSTMVSHDARMHLLLWNVSNDKPTQTVEIMLPAMAGSMAFSPEGKFLATGFADGSVRLFDVEKPSAPPVVISADATAALSLAVSRDANSVVAGFADGKIAILDFHTGHAPVQIVRGDPGLTDLIPRQIRHQSLQISSDGRYLALLRDDYQMWDLTATDPTPLPLQTDAAPPDDSTGDQPNPHADVKLIDGIFHGSATFAAIDTLGDLLTWDVPQLFAGKSSPTIAAGPAGVASLIGSGQIATVSPGLARCTVWNARGGTFTWDPLAPDFTYQPGPSVCPYQAIMAPLGENQCCVVDANGKPRLWIFHRGPAWIDPIQIPITIDPKFGASKHSAQVTELANSSSTIENIAFNPDGTRLAMVGSAGYFAASPGDHLWMWNLVRGRHAQLDNSSGEMPSTPRAPNPGIATSVINGNAAQNPAFQFRGGATASVGFSTDGRFLISAEGTRVHAWRTTRFSGKGSVFTCSIKPIHALAIRPGSAGDGFEFAVGSEEGEVNLWSCSSAGLILNRQFTGGQGRIRSMSFSSDGRWLACGGDDPVVRLWNLSEINSKPALLSGHTGPVETVVFDRQNSRLASGSRDGTVRLWNLSSPQTATAVLGPYSGAVRALSFDDAGDYLLIAANQTATEPDGQMGIPMMGRNDISPGSLLCYDLRPGHEHLPVLQMPGDFPEISSLLLSPDGTTLAAVCSDQKVRFWLASPTILTQLASLAVGRNLTRDEWERFVAAKSAIPYQSTCADLPPGNQ